MYFGVWGGSSYRIGVCQIGTRYGVQEQHQAVCDILIMTDNCAPICHTHLYEYLHTLIVVISDRADKRNSRSSSCSPVSLEGASRLYRVLGKNIKTCSKGKG